MFQEVKVTQYVRDRSNSITYLDTLSFASQDIFVPQSRSYSEFYSFLRVVSSDEYLGYSILVLVSVVLVLITFRYIEQNRILVVQSIADIVNLLMNDNGTIKYQQLSHAEMFLMISLTFTGFIFVNGILSIFQSHLTRPFYEPQIRTIQDIYRSDLNIFVVDNRFYVNRLLGALDDASLRSSYTWHNRIVGKDVNAIYSAAMRFERMSFLIEPAFYKPLLLAQKRLNVRGYEICYFRNPNPQLIAFTVNDAFPFMDRFNDIMRRVQSSGIFFHWRANDDLDKTKRMVRRYQLFLKKHNAASGNEDSTPMFLIWVNALGWAGGVIVFLCEIIWKKAERLRIICVERLRKRYNM